MEKTNLQELLQKKLVDHFDSFYETIAKDDIDTVKNSRREAISAFEKTGFPTKKMEGWRHSKIMDILSDNFELLHKPPTAHKDINEFFQCEMQDFDFDSEIFSFLNGWTNEEKLKTLSDGIIIGSIKAAMNVFPDKFQQYFGKALPENKNGFIQLNAAFWQDGIFILVPKGKRAQKPIQIIKLIDQQKKLFVQTRNLIILEENSELSIMDCDDSINHESSIINSVTEIFVEENAQLDFYKLQNINDSSILLNTSFAKQSANSSIRTNTLSFNGGMIRNDNNISLDGEGCNTDVYGLYLMDKKQHVDNQIKVHHNKANCNSNELFKGILDDEATAVFNGHIYVAQDAQKTNAYQNNSNLLLTSKAKINTMPFLEIYADDVKCSHGATIGQLDQEAMFYLRSRGISKSNARLLLMYAFASDIVNHIRIESLLQRIDDMVKKRLRGELSVCDKCILQCNKPEKEIHFDIDLSKI